MRPRRWLVGAMVAVAVGAAGVALVRSLGGGRPSALGPLRVNPAGDRLSLRVGELVQFSVAAEGAESVTWAIWGHPVSSGPTFSYAPGPEDAGWQHVTVEVTGRRRARALHSWDVGVVPAVAPEVVEVSPPLGRIALRAGEEARFRCVARVPAARPSDRMQFEWTVDGEPRRRDEQAAGSGVSEFVLSVVEPGMHHLAVRVGESERAASRVEWTLEVEAPAGPETGPRLAAVSPTTLPPTTLPSTTVPTTSPPTTLPSMTLPSTLPSTTVPPATTRPPAPPVVAARPVTPPRVVRAPGPREREGAPGDRMAFTVRVQPDDAAVSCQWSLDGKRVGGGTRELRYQAKTPGRHRIAVDVLAAGRRIGGDAWVVTVRVPAPPAAAATTSTTMLPSAAVAAATKPAVPPATARPGLAEADVRRWLEEYARAWSRKDAAALRRMGQVRSAAEVEKLERYFVSVEELQVRVRVLSVRVQGERASVEFERTDTVTDPAGRRHELRSPPVRREIERTPDGLRFVERGGAG